LDTTDIPTAVGLLTIKKQERTMYVIVSMVMLGFAISGALVGTYIYQHSESDIAFDKKTFQESIIALEKTQATITHNEETILHNQEMFLRNEETIIRNEETIIRNENSIVDTQNLRAKQIQELINNCSLKGGK
jgi:hypothetical protein